MPFEFKKTEIEGLMLIKPHMYPDERGLYKKYYEKNIFVENSITCEFTESSDLYSKKGALRGLHYQTVDSQAKLIHVISGVLFDVALDLRENENSGSLDWKSKMWNLWNSFFLAADQYIW